MKKKSRRARWRGVEEEEEQTEEGEGGTMCVKTSDQHKSSHTHTTSHAAADPAVLYRTDTLDRPVR